jgi:acyl-CoA synthetase (AMP-forming)/AMP-acid ligase II
LPGSEFTLYHS